MPVSARLHTKPMETPNRVVRTFRLTYWTVNACNGAESTSGMQRIQSFVVACFRVVQSDSSQEPFVVFVNEHFASGRGSDNPQFATSILGEK